MNCVIFIVLCALCDVCIVNCVMYIVGCVICIVDCVLVMTFIRPNQPISSPWGDLGLHQGPHLSCYNAVPNALHYSAVHYSSVYYSAVH